MICGEIVLAKYDEELTQGSSVVPMLLYNLTVYSSMVLAAKLFSAVTYAVTMAAI